MALDVSGLSTVGQVKEVLESREGVPVREQRLLQGARELTDSEAIPQSRITLVRQRMAEDNEFEQMWDSLRECDEQVNSVWSSVSSFAVAVASPGSWTESTHVEDCGCRTVTKKYEGQDPPDATVCRETQQDVSRCVHSCRSQLKEITQQTRMRHRMEQEQLFLQRAETMDAWTVLWEGFWFPCCMPPAPVDDNVTGLEAHCENLLHQASETRDKLTIQTMKASTKTTKTYCDAHMPLPPEPGSP